MKLTLFTEDVYDGTQGDSQGTVGHPWYLTTLAVAEHHYQLIAEYIRSKAFTVTPLSLSFFESLGVPNVRAGKTYRLGTPEFKDTIIIIGKYAESLFRRVKYHLRGNPKMDEQYSRFDGHPLSAENLTWSYASVLTTNHARKEAIEAMRQSL